MTGRNRRGHKVMTADDVVFLGRDAMMVTLLVSAPMLVSGLVIGLVISIFQSVTQIQEITLTFVPKIVLVMVSFVIFLPWMTDTMLEFVVPLFGDFSDLVLQEPRPGQRIPGP